MLKGRVQVAVVDIGVQEAAGDVGLVAKDPLCGAEASNRKALVELGYHEAEGFNQAFWAGRWIVLQIQLHPPS